MAGTFNTADHAGRKGNGHRSQGRQSPGLLVARAGCSKGYALGRVEETYGEDPYLVSRMASLIRGFQGEHMIAVPKHFAGHGEPLGGRDSHDVGLSDR